MQTGNASSHKRAVSLSVSLLRRVHLYACHDPWARTHKLWSGRYRGASELMLVLAGQQPYTRVTLRRPTSVPQPCVLYVVCESMALTTHGHGPTSYGVPEILWSERADACASRSAALHASNAAAPHKRAVTAVCALYVLRLVRAYGSHDPWAQTHKPWSARDAVE